MTCTFRPPRSRTRTCSGRTSSSWNRHPALPSKGRPAPASPRRALEHEHHLEQGRCGSCFARAATARPAARTGRPGERRRRATSFTRSRSAGNGRVAREVDAQDQRIDEEADQGLGLRARAAGDRRADADVGLSGVAVQEQWNAASSVMKSVVPALLPEGLQRLERRRRHHRV